MVEKNGRPTGRPWARVSRYVSTNAKRGPRAPADDRSRLTGRSWNRCVARALGALPRIDRALERGEISYAKVRAITRVATPGTEETLLQYARHATGAQLDRICRLYRQVAATARDPGARAEERSVRERVLPGGMVKLELVLTPDEAALILEAIDKAQRTLASEQTDTPAEASRDEGQTAGRPQRAADGAQAAGNRAQADAGRTQSAAARALAAARPTLADAAVLMAETYLHRRTEISSLSVYA
jgi:hypothetical protein